MYTPTIGIEVHVELKTKAKAFSTTKNTYGQIPNKVANVIDLGYPGTLPTLNKGIIDLGIKTALILNCDITREIFFDRKNYFYPDLPKAYQISQYDMPLCQNGHVDIEDENGEKKTIRILRIHIEEDAGKLNHDEYGRGSFVDLNRAGVPLIEVVSEPDLRSAEEAENYLRKLKSIFEYIQISDCKMQEGSLRADVNVSVRKKGATEFGTRTEMKNMNSFRSIVRAINYEAERQVEVIENGGTITQETLRWDDVSGKTFPMRDKEDAQDYRYFPDPDLVAIKLSDEYIEHIRKNLPELPEVKKDRYINDFELSEKAANFVTSSKYYSDIFDEATEKSKNPKAVSNWLMSDIARILNEKEEEADKIPFTGKELGELVELIDKGTISNSIGKKVLDELFENPKAPSEIIKEKGWIQISDEGAIKEVVLKVLENNPQSVADYKAGKDRALGFLVGQAMKETKGKANPQMLNKMFIEELKK